MLKMPAHHKMPAAVALVSTLVSMHVGAGSPAGEDEKIAAAAEQKSVAVTIYSNNLGLIKETRRVELVRDFNQLIWPDVAKQIRPGTARLRNPAHFHGFRVQELSFDLDLLTPKKLLEQYIGKEITVIRTNLATGEEKREAAVVLSANNGAVLKYANRVEIGYPRLDRLSFPGVPDKLRDKPGLVASFINPVAGEQDLELSYLTMGLSWHADYAVELNERDDYLDIHGWATMTNQSGTAYPNAILQLVAGDLNQVRQSAPGARYAMEMAKMAQAADMKQEGLFEYHLYSLNRPVTLAENQTKQVGLMSATRVPVRKEFLLTGSDYYYSSQYNDISRKLKSAVFVEFRNKGEGLGIPLPAGVVRAYQKDSRGNAQFLGEDQIDHTAADEIVRLKLGNAFDVTAERKQTYFQRLPGEGRGDVQEGRVFESAFEILLRNARKQAVVVTVREPIPGDWQMVSESQPHTRVSSNMAEWKVVVPAGGRHMLSYRVRVKNS
ncbi:MAG TPA: DUF4139 domain-containing protein [Nitrosospira sp.]|nr:DUF4139 domain-containing protein [Nitrosospira sp.]